eukprot:c24025_g3_i1 orf=248-439(+)
MQVSGVFEPGAPSAGSEAEHLRVSEFVLYDGKAHAAVHTQSEFKNLVIRRAISQGVQTAQAPS